MSCIAALHIRIPLLIAIILLLVPTCLIAWQTPAANKPLTNDDVVSLSKAGLTVPAILGLIDSSNCKFDLSAMALIKLKNDGVADAVIERIAKSGSDAEGSAERNDPRPSPAPSRPLPTSFGFYAIQGEKLEMLAQVPITVKIGLEYGGGGFGVDGVSGDPAFTSAE